MKETFKATIQKADDKLKVEADVRGFKMILDEPEEKGGTNHGMTPIEAQLCVLGACQTIVASVHAKKKNLNIEHFRVEIEGDQDPDGFTGRNPEVRNGFQEIRYTMYFKSTESKETLEEFAKFVENHCPIGDSLANSVKLTLKGVVVE